MLAEYWTFVSFDATIIGRPPPTPNPGDVMSARLVSLHDNKKVLALGSGSRVHFFPGGLVSFTVNRKDDPRGEFMDSVRVRCDGHDDNDKHFMVFIKGDEHHPMIMDFIGMVTGLDYRPIETIGMSSGNVIQSYELIGRTE